jgi:hypothetical protein
MKLWEYLGGNGAVKGTIGLEIETESLSGWSFSVDEHSKIDKHWDAKPDGSLRHNGIEFVFRQPLAYDGASYKLALKSFKEVTDRIKFMKSPYSSVHVHLNMLHKEMVHLFNFICLYFLFEEVLTEYCGNARNGNLFCLKTSNAELTYKTVKDLAKAVEDGTGGHAIRNLNNGTLKYSGLNIVPLRTFGSLEVRTHPGSSDIDAIHRWISILWQLFTKADTFQNPVDLISRMNGYGTKTAFANFIFGDYAQYLDLNHLNPKMEDGIWYATAVAAAVDNWKDFGNKKDNGGRGMKIKKVDMVTWVNDPLTLTVGTTGPTGNTATQIVNNWFTASPAEDF